MSMMTAKLVRWLQAQVEWEGVVETRLQPAPSQPRTKELQYTHRTELREYLSPGCIWLNLIVTETLLTSP